MVKYNLRICGLSAADPLNDQAGSKKNKLWHVIVNGEIEHDRVFLHSQGVRGHNWGKVVRDGEEK